jgi:protein-disulfide isomerase
LEEGVSLHRIAPRLLPIPPPSATLSTLVASLATMGIPPAATPAPIYRRTTTTAAPVALFVGLAPRAVTALALIRKMRGISTATKATRLPNLLLETMTMRNVKRAVLMSLAVVGCTAAAAAQESPKREAVADAAKCLTAEHELASKSSDAVTKEQADAIVGELKQIRQLLEKQQVQLALAVAPKPAATPAPPEKVQMNVGDGWYAIGRADAPVTLVEFADYQCPFCKQFHTAAYAELKKNYIDTGKVRFVSRDLPLEFHPLALKAAEAARCAGDQNKYWELRDALYANAAPPNDEVIKKAAESLSLDEKGFRACLDSDKYKADVQKDAGEAATLQISGTPTFVLAKSAKDKLNGVRIVGAQSFATFQAAIDGLLKTEVAMKN